MAWPKRGKLVTLASLHIEMSWRSSALPKLVISAAHDAAFDAVCDVLEDRLAAERAVLPGAGHSIPRAPGFNDLLEDFLGRSQPSEST